MGQIIEEEHRIRLQNLGFTVCGILETGTQGVIFSGNCNEHAVRNTSLSGDSDSWHENNHYSRSALKNTDQILDYKGRHCVIKILDIDNEPSLINEARILSRLKHKNIVAVYDVVIIDNSRLYIFMEHSSGGTLEDILKKSCSDKVLLPENDSINMVRDLLDGLWYLHEEIQCCHCDIHAVNVMIFTDANFNTVYKYIDFGLAVLEEDTTVTHERYDECVTSDIRGLLEVMNNINAVTQFQNPKYRQYMHRCSRKTRSDDVTLQQLIDDFKNR